MALAASLGADVPFFLVGGTALGLGRGDEVYPLMDVPRRNVVIVRPGFGVATRDAYAWLSERRGKRRATGTIGADGRVGLLSDASLRNDFEQVVEARHPAIRQIRQRLVALGATVARLSGSGSAVFGLFDTPAEANRARRPACPAGLDGAGDEHPAPRAAGAPISVVCVRAGRGLSSYRIEG